ncbi:MAG: hypothetical protein F4X68_03190 [Acidimicrobiia bacterium]|nr:hypothetical protein [Acidimicrobiia bacterium]MYB72956.1 hypothetical protein [Acidimicrobiia bacterium]
MSARPLDVLGAPGWGEVDARGLVRPGTGELTLDWWVGASDRWHRASQEAAVRQSEVGAGAVVETRMKVPDGDAVQRVWAVAAGGGPAVAVVEVGNEAATAFAVAMVVNAPGAVLTVDQTGVAVGGQPMLAWDRPPAGVAVGQDAVESLLEVEGGGATGLDHKGRDLAALVWPLPHSARLAVSASLGRGMPSPPSDLPDADAVLRGWQAHLDRGARIEVPDEGLARRIERNRRRWLGRTGRMETADVAEICELSVRLDHHGFHDDAVLVLDEISARWTTEVPTERLRAFTVHHDLTGDEQAAVRFVEAVAEAVEAAAKIGADVPVEPVERLLIAAGQDRAAEDFRRLDLSPAEPPSGGLRAELVADHEDELLVAPGFRPAWQGGPLAVYGLPTRFGSLSYAVRWHGARPALLWELDYHPGRKPVTLRAPALDEGWSSDQPAGETLLAASR